MNMYMYMYGFVDQQMAIHQEKATKNAKTYKIVAF